MYTAIYLAVWFAGSAMMIKEGLWSNTIALVNIVISGLVAFGFYSPIAIYFDELTNGEYTYLLDFVCIWTLFVIAMVVCRTLTGGFSRTRMRFKNPVEPVLGPLMAVLDSWVMAAFVMATLHTSPMPKDAFSSGLIYSDNEVESNGVESKWALASRRNSDKTSGTISWASSMSRTGRRRLDSTWDFHRSRRALKPPQRLRGVSGTPKISPSSR